MKNASMKIIDGKINFACRMENCNNNCCGPFSGITTELSSFDNRPFNEIVLTEDDYLLLDRNGMSHLIETGFSDKMQKKYYKMAIEEDGTCKAFKKGRCSIHLINPTLCKAFPFYFDMFSGLCAIKCEGFSDEYWTDLKKYEPCFDAAKKMYEFWIKFYSSNKENKE